MAPCCWCLSLALQWWWSEERETRRTSVTAASLVLGVIRQVELTYKIATKSEFPCICLKKVVPLQNELLILKIDVIMKRMLGLLTTLCALVGCQPDGAIYQSVDVATFAEIIQDSSVVLLDVRTQSEYEAGHIPNAILIDVTQADFLPKCKQQLPLDKTIALYCRSGNRSKKAAQLLSQEKYKVVELNTGFNSWKGEVEK